ncbi:MAG: HAD family hydrolase [Pseudomonadota bacterium]
MSQPDLIVWDFGGVLNANVVNGRFVWADDMKADLGIDPVAFSETLFASGKMSRIVRGEMDLRDVVAEFLEGYGGDVSADALIEYWFAKDARVDPVTLDLLTRYPARHVIGTNNEARRARFIEEEMGFGGRVERVFASGRLGIAKPEPGFFEAIETWSGAAPAAILLVDDNEPNIVAAEARGLRGFHFTAETRGVLSIALGL